MAAKLLYRDAQGKDAAVDLPQDGAFLGRAVDCIVRTDDAMVSRKNCKMSFLGGRWYVEDLGSANGTFVNDRKIQKETKELKQQVELNAQNIDKLSDEKKRLVGELQAAKDAAEKLRRQTAFDEQELREQTKVNEELRQENKQLKGKVGDGLKQFEDL